MANNLITNQMIAREAIPLFKNMNAFVMNAWRQYQDEFAQVGAKAGYSIRIRRPVDYALRRGPTAIVQNTVENVTNLTVASQAGVDMSFSLADRTMVIDRFKERYIRPAVNTTVGGLATDLMAVVEGGASGWAASYASDGTLLSPNAQTWLKAKAVLRNNEAPTGDLKIVMSPDSEANTVASLMGLFNSQPKIARQYDTGAMYQALGFDWMADQTVLVHTTGTLNSTAPTYVAGKGFPFTTVNGAAQGQAAATNTLTVAALTGTLKQGDIIVIENTFGVNPTTKASTGGRRHFTITADCPVGTTSIPIYPALLSVDGTGNSQQYQTVLTAPPNGAAVYCMTGAGVQYRKNIAYHPWAFTLAVVDMEMPPNVDAARITQDDISVRVVTQYLGNTDQNLTRLDMLYGVAALEARWAVVVPDPV